MDLYREIRAKLEPLADPMLWVRAAPKVQPLVTIAVLAVYCSGLHLLYDNTDRRFLYQAIVLKHLSGNVTDGIISGMDEILTVVEVFLDSTYKNNAALSWKSVLEAPGLRQITLKESPCFVSNAPRESCEQVLVKKKDVNTTCTLCWTTTSIHSHICAVPDPEHDGGDGTCVQGCEHGFGFCSELGDTTTVKGHLIREGGHGLYMPLDADRNYKNVLKRLRDLGWLTRNSRYVSLFLTTLSDTDTVARVRLHFLKYLTGQWSISHDVTLGRFPNYFPNYYHDKPLVERRQTCDKVLYYFVKGPRDRQFRAMMQNILLVLPALLLLLTAVETPYLWRLFTTTRDLTWEDKAVLVINLAGLGLHGGLCAVLYLSRLGVINIICDMYRNYGKLKWLETLSTSLLLLLVLLWFVKLFCIQSVLFEPLTRCMRLARGGVTALLIVPFFLLPLVVLGGAMIALQFADASTSDLRQAAITVSWAALGQARLTEAWPVLAIVRFVSLFLFLPLAVAMAGAAMSYTLVATERAEEEKREQGGTTVPAPL